MVLCAKEGKKRVPSTRAENPGLHPNFTCVRGDKGCRNPIPAEMLRKPGDLPQVCPRPKKFKRVATRDTLHGSRPNLQQREPDTVELCPPHPTFETKVPTRRDAPEGEKNHNYTYLIIYTYSLAKQSLRHKLTHSVCLFPLCAKAVIIYIPCVHVP